MAEPAEFASDVQISLTDLSVSPADPEVAERCIVLNPTSASLIIGRASKTSSKGFIAATDNGWFESQVMSRRHAEITVSPKKEVLIRDLGSLHGTFVNDEVEGIPKQEPRELKDGDKVKFGASVVRGVERFTPTTVKVGIAFEYRSRLPSTTFRVPEDSDDGSDAEDNASENSKAPEKEMIDLTVPNFAAPINRPTYGGSNYEVIDMTSSVNSPRITPVVVIDDEDELGDGDESYWNMSNNETAERIEDTPSSPLLPRDIGVTIDADTQGCMGSDGYSDGVDTGLIDEDDISTRSIRLSTDEDLPLDSDLETSSSQSGESEAHSDLNDESDCELEEESQYEYQLHPNFDSDEGDPEDDEIEYDSSDADVDTEDQFWVRDADVAPMVPPGYPPASGPASSHIPVLTDPQETFAVPDQVPLKVTALTIGGMLNDDKPKESSRYPLFSPLLTSTSLPRQPSPSDVIMSKSSLNGKTDVQAANIEAEISGKANVKISKCLETEDSPISAERSPPMAAVTPGEILRPLLDNQPSHTSAALPPPPYSAALKTATHSSDPAENRAGYQARWVCPPISHSLDSSRRTHLGISDIVDACHQGTEKSNGKRKADAISTLSDEEEAWEALQPPRGAEMTTPLSPLSSPSSPPRSPKLAPVPQPALLADLPPVPAPELSAPSKHEILETPKVSKAKVPAVDILQPTEGRASKRLRLRHIAERVGYAALGGVTAGAMIFGTLVYTAPSFS